MLNIAYLMHINNLITSTYTDQSIGLNRPPSPYLVILNLPWIYEISTEER